MAISPVTGIFVHHSTNVWDLVLTGGEHLGVTGNHPIYSLDKGDWVEAARLQVGEQVLTKDGMTVVESLGRNPGAHKVYNVEVKDYHNFLVGESGVVVHNVCSKDFLKELMDDPDFDDILVKLPSGQVKDNLLTLKAWKTATPPDPKYQKFLDDFDVDVPVERVKAWKEALDNGIDEIIRKNPDYLTSLSKFPFGTGKKKIVDEATDGDFVQLLSGKLKDVPDQNPAVSTMLKDKFGPSTKTSKKFDTDPSAKEFDAITDDLLIEHKSLTSTNPMSTAKRTQMKYQMRSCKALGKDIFLMFEGVQNDDWINKAIQYANQYQVNTKIELNGTILHDLVF